MPKDLYTPQGEKLTASREIPWQVYPRPQLKRDSYVNLNGDWEFAVSTTANFPQQYPHTIRVPFCPESMLSGLHMAIEPGSYLFYRRQFSLPAGFHQGRVLLHIGAADQVAEVYVNLKRMGGHVGGYNSFTVDITDALEEVNTLVIRVFDDLRDTTLPYGKQSLKRGGMWYTPVSGIWQTVWLESVPQSYIEALDIQVTQTAATVAVTPALNGKVVCEGKTYPMEKGKAVITPEDPHLWSPEDPYLYEFTVETEGDRIGSYFALRTLETKTVNGYPRLCLNGKPVFFHGLLDQGYWSDGLYTPATPECYANDILAMKRLGYNTLRKHIKVEPEEFYYQCDKLGMFVFQDMVNNSDYNYLRDTVLPTFGIQKRSDKQLHKNAASRKAFYDAMEETVHQLKNHPSLVYWTIFNEGWGQFDSQHAYERMKQLDGSRFVGSTSGWFKGADSDVKSHHLYYTWVTKWSGIKAADKPLVLTEFGGYAHPVEGHMFNPEKVYGYKICQSREAFQEELAQLYRQRIIPLAEQGLCAAIYTEVSDVEDEINGLLTYDRRVCKIDPETMLPIAQAFQQAIKS